MIAKAYLTSYRLPVITTRGKQRVWAAAISREERAQVHPAGAARRAPADPWRRCNARSLPLPGLAMNGA